MAFNGSGTFSRLHNWQQDAANGIDIMADRMDAEMDGFAAGLSLCITRDGQGVPTADIYWGTQDLTGVGAFGAVSGAFTGNVSVGGTFGATGNATFGGTLAATGNATLGGTLAVTSNATVGGTFAATGNATLGGTLAVTGNATVGGTFGITGAMTTDINFNGKAAYNLYTGSSVKDAGGTSRLIGYRGMPVKSITTAYTVTNGDVGYLLEVGAGGSIILPRNSTLGAGAQFTPGDTIIIQEVANATRSISAAASTTLIQTGSGSTGTRTLKAYGTAAVKVSGALADTWFISGDIT